MFRDDKETESLSATSSHNMYKIMSHIDDALQHAVDEIHLFGCIFPHLNVAREALETSYPEGMKKVYRKIQRRDNKRTSAIRVKQHKSRSLSPPNDTISGHVSQSDD